MEMRDREYNGNIEENDRAFYNAAIASMNKSVDIYFDSIAVYIYEPNVNNRSACTSNRERMLVHLATMQDAITEYLRFENVESPFED